MCRCRSRTISGPRRWSRLFEVWLYFTSPALVRSLWLTVRLWGGGCTAKKDAVEAAKVIVKKLAIKNGTYMPDSYPNPGASGYVAISWVVVDFAVDVAALAFHNEQLEATAFREEYEADSFEDVTAPNYDTIHKVRVPPPRTFIACVVSSQFDSSIDFLHRLVPGDTHDLSFSVCCCIRV